MRISDWSSDVCSSDLPSDIQRDAERVRVEKAERDRALAAERKHKARIAELASQARQIIEDKKVPCSGELEYRFTDGAIRTLLINESLRRQLADRKSTRLNSSH